MREILYRGKTASGEWVKGVPLISGTVAFITQMHSGSRRVDIKTIGQDTDLADFKGKRIFEGDILAATPFWRTEPQRACEYWTVEYKNYSDELGFFVFNTDRSWHKPITQRRIQKARAIVVGNIHDNPEILNKE